MAVQSVAFGARLLRLWKRSTSLPAGSWVFSKIVGRMVPYTGALRSRVDALRPGYARVVLRDRRGIRNHLRSIHAVALANLGEFAGGLAMMTALAPSVRGIVSELRVEYTKKARGRLVAECQTAVPAVERELVHTVRTIITDENGDVVARVSVNWNLRPV
jgi:acyl-coenzyme A thioesterase PaaI-like protein